MNTRLVLRAGLSPLENTSEQTLEQTFEQAEQIRGLSGTGSNTDLLNRLGSVSQTK